MGKLTDITQRYIVVPVGGVDLAELSERDDLRVADDELDTGVHALWADDEESIVAFAFMHGTFDEQQARTWTDTVEGRGVNMSLARSLFGYVLGLLGRLGLLRSGQPPVAASQDNESFRHITDRLKITIEQYYGIVPGNLVVDSGMVFPWINEVYRDYCIVEYDGELWRFPYSFDENDEVVISNPEKVKLDYVAAAIVAEKYRVASARNFPLAEEERPWSWTTAKQNAILDAGGWPLFGQAHLVVELEEGKASENKTRYHLPVAELIDGKLSYVWAGVRAARGALAGARGGVDLPAEVKTAILDGPVAAIYKKFGKEDLLGSQMFVFSLALGTARAPVGLDDGSKLVWKEVLKAGTTFKPVDGEPLTVDQAMLDALVESFSAEVLDNVAITADDHFWEKGGIVPAEKTVGFVRKLKKVGDRLWAGLDVLAEEVKDKLGSLIKDVSVFAWPDFHDRRDGKKWDWVLVHLLLTNYPQVVGLAPFEEKPVAASANWPDVVVQYRNREVNTMPEGNQVAMTQQDVEALQTWRGLGLTVEQVQQMQKAHRGTLQKARALEISAIVSALEGRGTHEAVVALDGARHYPVVVKAVEDALRSNGVEGLALDVSAEGRSPLDAVVLGIVNALPLEARLVAQTAPAAPAPQTPTASGPPNDAAIDALDSKIG